MNQRDGPLASSTGQSESDRDPDGIDDHAGSTPGTRQVGDRDKWEIVLWNGAINDDGSSKGLPPKQLPEALGDCVVVARVRDGPTSAPALTQRMHLQTVSPLPRSRCARSGVSREPDDRGKR